MASPADQQQHQEQQQYDADDDCQYIFPQRLMNVLSDERNHDAICWLPHGRGFIIRNRKLFAEKVMPRFFPRKSKYSSFTRKLNRWNFNRVSSGPELVRMVQNKLPAAPLVLLIAAHICLTLTFLPYLTFFLSFVTFPSFTSNRARITMNSSSVKNPILQLKCSASLHGRNLPWQPTSPSLSLPLWSHRSLWHSPSPSPSRNSSKSLLLRRTLLRLLVLP